MPNPTALEPAPPVGPTISPAVVAAFSSAPVIIALAVIAAVAITTRIAATAIVRRQVPAARPINIAADRQSPRQASLGEHVKAAATYTAASALTLAICLLGMRFSIPTL